MKVFAVSDLHLSFASPKPMDIFGREWEGYETRLAAHWRAAVDPRDIVLIAGDVSWAMNFAAAAVDLAWIAALPGRKVLLRGNHDYWWKSISAMRAAFPAGIYAVQNDCLRFGSLLVCGTRGWTIPEPNVVPGEQDARILAREGERLALTLAAMERERRAGDCVIAMTHYPPFNSRRAPSPFLERLAAARVDAVVYGHLHGRAGRRDRKIEIGGIPYYLTSLDQIDADPVLIREIADES